MDSDSDAGTITEYAEPDIEDTDDSVDRTPNTGEYDDFPHLVSP